MKNTIMTIIKYLFALVLIIYASFFYKSILYFIFGLTELLFIFFLSNFLLRKKRIIGLIVNDILILLLNINYIVLIFGGTYVSTIMLSNLSSIPTLGHKLIVYGISLLFVIALSVLPVKAYSIKKDYFVILLFIREIKNWSSG